VAQPDSSPYAPPAEGWIRVSDRLITARRLSLVLPLLLVALAFLVAAAVSGIGWLALGALAALLALAWVWWLTARQVRAIGYAQRAEDLLVTSGIMFKRLVVVPYGRMQTVDVVAGPIDQRLGIARLQLHTASATTDASIPGLPAAEAARLRDELAARGEARSAGL
jgi:hypothetical protein